MLVDSHTHCPNKDIDGDWLGEEGKTLLPVVGRHQTEPFVKDTIEFGQRDLSNDHFLIKQMGKSRVSITNLHQGVCIQTTHHPRTSRSPEWSGRPQLLFC